MARRAPALLARTPWYDWPVAADGLPEGVQRVASGEGHHAPDASQPKTHRGRRTRELIAAAARRVFEEKGFLDARIADIAAAAGMSHGTFYTYFQTKDEVFRVIMSEVAEAQFEATRVPEDLPADPRVRIEYTIREYLRSYQRTARLSGVIEQVAIVDEQFRQARLDVRREFRDRIERGIQRMQDRGVADPAISARTAAEAITSMLSNFAYVSLTLAEHYDEDEAVATLTSMWTGGIGLRTS